ncbi:MAG: DNA-binding protein [Candidatus Cloacimonetes bacterium]|nr:DNA-binding protein [Candidatus Cloacimonadota bacterium]
MLYKKLDGLYFIRIDRGEKIVEQLRSFCDREKILTGIVNGIGAVDQATIGLYDPGKKEYHSRSREGNHEITSLQGNITRQDGKVHVHVHINLADEELRIWGGHLNEARVSATCEIIVQTVEAAIERFYEDNIGLQLLKLE